jgi:transcriptional regulator with XRE-family HTH domain
MECKQHPLRLWRKKQGLTQTELAAELKQQTGRRIRPSHVSQIEQGVRKPSLQLAGDLSKITGIPMEKFADHGECSSCR